MGVVSPTLDLLVEKSLNFPRVDFLMVDLFQNLRFASPGWLAALLLVPLVVVAMRGSLARESTLRRVATVTLRASALSLLVLALCSPVVDTPNHTPWAVLLVDQSASLDPDGARTAKAFVASSLTSVAQDRIVVVPFASEPGKPAAGKWPKSPQFDTTGTDLLAAFDSVSSVSRSFGPERVVLLSDGNATVPGDVISAVVALQTPLDTVPLKARSGPDVWIEDVTAPSEVRPGNSVPLEVLVESSGDRQVRVCVTCDGEEVDHKDVAVSGRLVVPFELELGRGPRDLYRAVLEAAADSQQANNWAEVAVWHGVPARALLVGRETNRFSPLARALGREKFEVETILADRFPKDVEQLSQFDLVVLADVPATEFTAQQLDAVELYVRDRAGGLLVFGGQDSLTAGGYQGTALERSLPVTCEFDVQAKRPSLAIVLVIDQSGSMEEGGAIGLAKTALRQTVQMLDAQDALGVIAFQDATQWIVPLQPCDNKQKVFREIDTLGAGGGTNMHPAIAKAHLALHEAYADLKHIIVLTDGLSYPGDFDTLASEIAASGATISTVAVGSEAAEPLLQSIAELGGGNYHHCTSAAEVPEIFVRETAKAARMGIREEPFFPKVDATLATIASLADDKPPALLGYVQTKARPKAQVGMASESSDPLVAWWQYGRGRTAVFTSDLRGAWTRPWQNWAGLNALWTALARQTVRPAQIDGYRLTCNRQGETTLVTLDAVPYPGRFENDAEVVLDIVSPDRSKQRILMPRIAPGQYAVHVAAPDAGTYDFQAICKVAERTVFAGRCSACPRYPDEWTPRETNEPLLRELAAATGGRFNPASGELFSDDQTPSVETHGLWHYLLLAAVLLLLAELSLRRLAS